MGAIMVGRKTLLSILLTFGWSVALTTLGLAQEGAVGKTIGIIGTVEYQALTPEPVAAGQSRPVAFQPWEKVKFHQPVFTSDQFRTQRKSRLKILFNDESLMALGPNTTMRVDSYLYSAEDKLRQGTINILHGLSSYIINKSQNNKQSLFRIVTPTANMAARGTQGYIGVTPGKTLVANQAGQVSVRNSDPTVIGEVVVGPMMKTVIHEGEPPQPPVPLTQTELNLIRQIILGKLGASGTTGPGEPSLITIEGEEAEDEDGVIEEFGTEEDFAEIYEPFDPEYVESCSNTGS